MDKNQKTNLWLTLAKRPIRVLAIVLVASLALAAGASVSAKGGPGECKPNDPSCVSSKKPATPTPTGTPLPDKAIETKQTVGSDSVSPNDICEAGTTGEWHFVITQLASAAQAPAIITITFDVGIPIDVDLEKVTGGTAHYRYVGNLEDDLISATAEIYGSWSGSFNVSHTPCGKEDTTTVTTLYNSDDTLMALDSDGIGHSSTGMAYDTATVLPAEATGTVNFKLFASIDCTGTEVSSEDKAVGVQSSTTAALAVGSYSFLATYSGDENYNGSVAACEPFQVTTIKFYKTAYAPEPEIPAGGTFNFLADGGLWDVLGDVTTPDGGDESTASGSSNHLYIAPGQHVVSETDLPDGWTLVNSFCGQANATDSGIIPATFVGGDVDHVVSFTVLGGLDWHCVFVNEDTAAQAPV